MSDEESLPGAPAAQDVGARFQALEAQLAQLSNMVQTGVKLETVGVEDQESVRVALEGLDGGVIFNEAVASQYMQAKQQPEIALKNVILPPASDVMFWGISRPSARPEMSTVEFVRTTDM